MSLKAGAPVTWTPPAGSSASLTPLGSFRRLVLKRRARLDGRRFVWPASDARAASGRLLPVSALRLHRPAVAVAGPCGNRDYRHRGGDRYAGWRDAHLPEAQQARFWPARGRGGRMSGPDDGE